MPETATAVDGTTGYFTRGPGGNTGQVCGTASHPAERCSSRRRAGWAAQ